MFARRSAIGALALGMLGQVVYHLLAAAHAARAPWPVVVLVSCLPVVTLGFGAALTHLLREAVPKLPAALNWHAHAAAELSAADIEAGRVPGIGAIRSGLHVGQDKATQVQAVPAVNHPHLTGRVAWRGIAGGWGRCCRPGGQAVGYLGVGDWRVGH